MKLLLLYGAILIVRLATVRHRNEQITINLIPTPGIIPDSSAQVKFIPKNNDVLFARLVARIIELYLLLSGVSRWYILLDR